MADRILAMRAQLRSLLEEKFQTPGSWDHITRQILSITLKLCCTVEVGNRPGLAEFIRHGGRIQGAMDDYRAINGHKQVGRGDV